MLELIFRSEGQFLKCSKIAQKSLIFSKFKLKKSRYLSCHFACFQNWFETQLRWQVLMFGHVYHISNWVEIWLKFDQDWTWHSWNSSYFLGFSNTLELWLILRISLGFPKIRLFTLIRPHAMDTVWTFLPVVGSGKSSSWGVYNSSRLHVCGLALNSWGVLNLALCSSWSLKRSL